ncbi:MAG: YHS domain-containing (seleno)protein [Hyphomicrobiaceae bacterium]|nr:YHS domain-containing (seleno)protein [Hyphomicrobiaceae bacterium]
MTFTLRTAAAALAIAFALPTGIAFAADEHYIVDGAAIGGYDPVAFHTAGKPTKGSAEFKADYQGVTWHFASAANRDLFAAAPAKYAPAYGGWCSAGASKGKKVATKPEFWKIVDGQLYLNSSEAAHTKLFLADPPAIIRKGEMNWKVIYATPATKL